MNLAQASRKQIKKAVASDFVGSFSMSLFNFAISLYILKLTGSALNFGTTLLIGPLVGIAFSPLIGYVADHYDNKRVMILAQSTCAGLLSLYGLFFPLFGRWHYLMVLLIVATIGLNQRLVMITYQSAVSRMVERPFMQRLNSLEQSASSLANIVGPIAAGALFALVPFSFFIYFEIVAELLVILIIATMNFHLIEVPEQIGTESETMWQSMKQGLIYVKKRRLILYMMIGSAILNFLFGIVTVGFPYLMVHVLRLHSLQYSLTEAVFSLGMVAGGLLAARVNIEGHPLNVVCKALLIAGLPIIFSVVPLVVPMTAWLSTVVFCLLYFVMATALVFANVPVQTYMQQTIPANFQGRVFTIMMVGCTSLLPVGMFVYGALFQYMPAVPVIIVTFLAFMLLTVVAMALSKSSSLKRTPAAGTVIEGSTGSAAVRCSEERLSSPDHH
ncbi:MAG: MFS transporter [Sporolactobacillus sp.]|jgi:MFS family permease|nr:MFS transporter [Sporolactobacillus sp.]